MSKRLAEKIEDLYKLCSTGGYTADFRSISKIFWPLLDNNLTILDLAGIFSVALAGNKIEILDPSMFLQFVNGVAKVKFPVGNEFTEMLVDELRNNKAVKVLGDSTRFTKIMDKSVMKVLLQSDSQLRRIFASFAGKRVRLGAGLTWSEVKSQSAGMEIDGFLSFAGAYGIIPNFVPVQKCEGFLREVLSEHPLFNSLAATTPQILFPQFQLILCIIALNHFDGSIDKTNKKLESREASDIIAAFLKDTNINRMNPVGSATAAGNSNTHAATSSFNNTSASFPYGDDEDINPNRFAAATSLNAGALKEKPENMYSAAQNQARYAMLIRIDQLFDDIHTKLTKAGYRNSSLLSSVLPSVDDISGVADKHSSKPVVIGDALPVPASLPRVTQQLLEAALAHHNLGNYAEALKFLDAVRAEYIEMSFQQQDEHSLPSIHNNNNSNNNNSSIRKANELPLDLDVYILLCQGNVYQSSGDDEQSLLRYMRAWNIARAHADKDWEYVCLNCIGMLAYYSVRFEVALFCFKITCEYREEVSVHLCIYM